MSQSAPSATTTDLVSPSTARWSLRSTIALLARWFVGIVVGIVVGFVGFVGFSIGWKLAPPTTAFPTATTADPPAPEDPRSPTTPTIAAEQAKQIRGQTLWDVRRALQRGILIIEDGEAQTVTKNRAALGSNQGYAPLEYGEYRVIHYNVDKDGLLGIGLAGDLASFSFQFLWRRGKTPPPSQPYALEVGAGQARRVIAKEN